MLLYLLWKIADSNKYEYDICMKGWVKWGLKRTREDYQKGHIWRHRFLRCDRYYVSNYEIRNKSTSELLKYQYFDTWRIRYYANAITLAYYIHMLMIFLDNLLMQKRFIVNNDLPLTNHIVVMSKIFVA